MTWKILVAARYDWGIDNSMLVTTLSLSIFYQPIKQRTALVQLANMGHNSDKLYVTHSEHAAGSHTASSFGKRQETGKSEFQRLPLYVLFSSSSAYDPRNLIMCVCVCGIVIAVLCLFNRSKIQSLLYQKQKQEKRREQMSLTFWTLFPISESSSQVSGQKNKNLQLDFFLLMSNKRKKKIR